MSKTKTVMLWLLAVLVLLLLSFDGWNTSGEVKPLKRWKVQVFKQENRMRPAVPMKPGLPSNVTILIGDERIRNYVDSMSGFRSLDDFCSVLRCAVQGLAACGDVGIRFSVHVIESDGSGCACTTGCRDGQVYFYTELEDPCLGWSGTDCCDECWEGPCGRDCDCPEWNPDCCTGPECEA